MRLLYVFSGAAAVVVAAVWSLGSIDAWWALGSTFVIYVLATGAVMWALAQTLAAGHDEQAVEPPSEEEPTAEPLPAPRRLGHLRRPLPH